MFDLLQRLYRAKLQLLAVILTVVGLALLFLAQWADQASTMSWLSIIPVKDIGSGLFTLGLISILLDYVVGQDNERRQIERMKSVFGELATQMRDAVIAGFAFKSDDLARVATPETLDQIIRNSLALRLGDQSFAEEVYDDIRNQAIQSAERWHDTRVSIKLSAPPIGGSSPSGRTTSVPSPALFIVTARWEYTVIPKTPTRRFVCVSDPDEYRELAEDRDGTSAWFLRPVGGLDGGDREAFELVQFTVNGEARSIHRTARADSQSYTVTIGKDAVDAGQPVVIAYTYRTVVRQGGNMLNLSIEQPSKGLSVEMEWGDCGIAEMRLLDFIASSEKTWVTQSPTSVPPRTISLDFDGWVFPRSGVAFVWVLDATL